jgi:hypothetical protein
MRRFLFGAVRNYSAFAGALATLGLLSSCDLQGNVEDLGGSLLDPDAALLDVPGRKLADGRYSNLELDGSLETGGYVLAKRYDLEEQALSVISFVGDGQCEVSPMAAFQRVSSRVDVALPGLVAYQRTRSDSGIGDVEFIGFDCAPKLQKVPDASLPDVPFPRSAPEGMLTLSEDGTLSYIDVVGERIVTAVEGVGSGRAESSYLWTLENSVVKVYDASFSELASWGDNVSDLLILGADHDPSAAIVDDAGLSFVDLETGEKTLIAADGCEPKSLGSNVIAYLSPCASRTLKLSVPGSLLLSSEDRVTIEVASNVIHHESSLADWKGKESELVYVKNEDASATTGQLHVLAINEDPEQATDRVLAENAFISGSNVFLDWDGQTGRLMTLVYDESSGTSVVDDLSEVATDVAQLPGGSFLSDRGVLVSFDGEVGDLCVLTESESGYSCALLGSKVPVQTQAVEEMSDAFAFVGDYDGTSGTAYLVIDGNARAIGQDALPGTLRFLEEPRAVAYLAHNGVPGTATLRAWLIDAELDLHVADRVSEYRELPWPSPGLLYAIPEGDTAGIWFAKAR